LTWLGEQVAVDRQGFALIGPDMADDDYGVIWSQRGDCATHNGVSLGTWYQVWPLGLGKWLIKAPPLESACRIIILEDQLEEALRINENAQRRDT
jgi:hypothetical protein